MRHLFPKGVLEAAGITRVARVTALDRTGVEVACAIRPTGHVLQVSQGKGRTFDDAARSAVSEAVELWAAEHPDTRSFVWATERELERTAEVWSPAALGALTEPALWHSELRLPWVRAKRLGSLGHVWVPAQLVACPPGDGADVGLLVSGWTSNGMGAHPRRAQALRHAVLELLERHALSQVLPTGWALRAVRTRRVRPDSAVAFQLERGGFELALFDLTPAGWRGLSVAGALLRDTRRGPNALTAGYACRATFADATYGAISEAAQSRLTDIHGAREDIAVKGSAPERADGLFRLPARRPSLRRRQRTLDATELVRSVELRVAVVDLSPPGFGLSVVKVLSPDARLSELVS